MLTAAHTLPPAAETNTFPHEDAFSAAFHKYCWNNFPQTRGKLWHVANETKRAKGETVRDHAMRVLQARAIGVVKGVSDWHFYWRGKLHVLELKQPGGTVSPEQSAFGAGIVAEGGTFTVAYNMKEAVEWVTRILSAG